MKAIRRFNVRTVLPAPIAELAEIASNLRWSWHEPTRQLFATMDPMRWESTGGDPLALLSSLSTTELEARANDPHFVDRVRGAYADLHAYMNEPRWYQEWSGEQRQPTPQSIAYFSAEFGITEVLPQYSGGLGILAGDHLKSASDLGVPITGVGLFYQSGYFKQSLNRDGWQQETYPVCDPDGLPLSLLREPNGTAATISLALPGGRTLRAYIWKAQVGRVPLLMLDSNVQENEESLRHITDRLYGGGGEQRLLQELLLGIGGIKALRVHSRLTGAPAPEVYHANEGHAGFLTIERVSELVTSTDLTFDQAREAVRASTVFTTHTPVPAGIDRFGVDQIRHYFSGDCEMPGVPIDKLIALGSESYPGGDPGVFNMAVMGLRMAKQANGVSKLHGVVSREMFNGLWPGFEPNEVPITSVTNGVHASTWVDDRLFQLYERHWGVRDIAAKVVPGVAERASDEDLWWVKREMREQLVTEARRRVRESWMRRGATAPELGWTDSILDPDVLTIGFARRGATYKRLTLMLRDPVRLKKMLLHPERPIQIVIAGKSHPADDLGKGLIQSMVRFADDPEIRHRVIFLPNYDIGMARILYPGCDVWLNNPLRPMEACGTSGMKAALNAGLNLSILDGWWDEWYDGENGWSIPTADGVEDPNRRDDLEATALYDLIEHNVAPRFYGKDEHGIPRRWVAMMRHTLANLGPKVMASRMVRDYTEQLYEPAAIGGRLMAENGYELARLSAEYAAKVREQWHHVRVDHIESSGVADSPIVGDTLHVRSFVHLGELRPDEVQVQIIYGRVNEVDELTDTDCADLSCHESLSGGIHRFEGDVRLARTGAFGYSVRVLPKHPSLRTAHELGLVVNA